MSGITIPPEYSNLDSLVSIYGTVQAIHKRCLDRDQASGPANNLDDEDRCECLFSIVNDDGRFSIRAIWSAQQCDRLPASQVQVIGRLHSTFFRQCHQHHHQIEALVVIILAPDRHGRDRVLSVLQSERFTSEGDQQKKA